MSHFTTLSSLNITLGAYTNLELRNGSTTISDFNVTTLSPTPAGPPSSPYNLTGMILIAIIFTFFSILTVIGNLMVSAENKTIINFAHTLTPFHFLSPRLDNFAWHVSDSPHSSTPSNSITIVKEIFHLMHSFRIEFPPPAPELCLLFEFLTFDSTHSSFLSPSRVLSRLPQVMISFKIDKQLQTISNYFLFSLAIADLAIGLISMPLFTVSTILGHWPLGPFVCDTWLALDYLASNASVLNLLIISFDRYFSVTRPLTYRAKRTTNRAAFMIAMAWGISLLLWPPWIYSWPYIEGE
jgi:7 transmembrane receptor (rhodopsin family)